jgi:hypothetical protein
MKKTDLSLRLFSLIFVFSCFTSASAQEFSCDDLISISDSTAEVRDALIELGTINEGDEVDSALNDLIGELEDVAEYEQNYALEAQVAMMSDGWTDLDGDALMSGLNGAISSMDSLISYDCD